MAVSYDGVFLASCGKDKKIKIWDTTTHSLKETFVGHRDSVTVRFVNFYKKI